MRFWAFEAIAAATIEIFRILPKASCKISHDGVKYKKKAEEKKYDL